jgi:Sigma-70, region 4
LRDIYDLSHEAIAKQLDISETAAKVRLHRARHKLRELLFGDEVASASIGTQGDDDQVSPVASERETQDTSTMAVVRRVKARAPRIGKDRTAAIVLDAEPKLAQRTKNGANSHNLSDSHGHSQPPYALIEDGQTDAAGWNLRHADESPAAEVA